MLKLADISTDRLVEERDLLLKRRKYNPIASMVVCSVAGCNKPQRLTSIACLDCLEAELKSRENQGITA